MSIRARRFSTTALAVAAILAFAPGAATQSAPFQLPAPEQIAPGVSFYKLDAPAYFGEGSPISARLLEIHPSGATLDLAAGDQPAAHLGRATVDVMAARRGAIAAVNAGFFLANGDPAGIYKIDGHLVSDTARPRGAVGLTDPARGMPLLFDRVTARAQARAGGKTLPLAGVDTVRPESGVTLYTPFYGDNTKTKGGTEWTFRGTPLRLTSIQSDLPSPIPADGVVLSTAGMAPAQLSGIRVGAVLDLRFDYRTSEGTPSSAWQKADDIVGGAGLLLARGRAVAAWQQERLDPKGFVDMRHPRTMIGRDREGDTWLVVVDGRQPAHSVGMTLGELTAVARALGLVDALNLDGGGSSTMVVKGKIVNKPSDPTGPRPVSDAILVFSGKPTPR